MELRVRERRGPDWIAAELGVPVRTVSRVIARRGLPRLSALGSDDRAVGSGAFQGHHHSLRAVPARRSLCTSTSRSWGASARAAAGACTGARARPARAGPWATTTSTPVDDHSRLAYSEIHPDERGQTCAGFLARAAAFFAAHGITAIERVMTDNAFAYRHSTPSPGPWPSSGRPHPDPPPLPLDERQGRALQPHAPARVGLRTGLHQQRSASRAPARLARALQHPAPPQLPGRPPADQPGATNLMARYT